MHLSPGASRLRPLWFGVRKASTGDAISITKYEFCVQKGNEQKCSSVTLIFPPKWHFFCHYFLSVYATCLQILWLFSLSVVSDSLQPHVLQHARLPCPSLSPRICSNSCPLSHQWMPSTILSSVIPLHTTFVKSYRVSWCGNRGALLTSYTHVHTQHSTCPWVRFMGCPHHLARQRDCGRPSICSWFSSVQSLSRVRLFETP